jgi:hypothetical protein
MRFNNSQDDMPMVAWGPSTSQDCGLWFCVETYNISVSQGTQTQRVLATSESVMNVTGLPNASKYANWILPVSSQQSDRRPGEVEYFSVSRDIVEALRLYLKDMLQGNFSVTWQPRFEGNRSRASSQVMAAFGLYGAPTVVRNLAKSMTNHLRTETTRYAVNTSSIDGEVNVIGPTNRTSDAGTLVRMINGSTLWDQESANITSPAHVNGPAYSLEPFFNVR